MHHVWWEPAKAELCGNPSPINQAGGNYISVGAISLIDKISESDFFISKLQFTI